MSKETLHLMMNLDQGKLDTQIALQCAPLLTGVKMSNLLTVDASKREEVMRLFHRTAISCYVLCSCGQRATFLLYVKETMMEYLRKPDVDALMSRFGCGGKKLGMVLRYVSLRYRAHMDGNGPFPHEIGLLLGYPPEDVAGFVKNEGENFLYRGYWKVYSNLPDRINTFKGYNRAREEVIHMVSRGIDISGILEIHELNHHKSIAI